MSDERLGTASIAKPVKTCYVFCKALSQALSWIADENGDICWVIPLIEKHLPDSFNEASVLLLPGWMNCEDYTEPFKKRVKSMMRDFNGSV